MNFFPLGRWDCVPESNITTARRQQERGRERGRGGARGKAGWRGEGGGGGGAEGSVKKVRSSPITDCEICPQLISAFLFLFFSSSTFFASSLLRTSSWVFFKFIY